MQPATNSIKAVMMYSHGDQTKGRSDPINVYSPIARILLSTDDMVRELTIGNSTLAMFWPMRVCPLLSI